MQLAELVAHLDTIAPPAMAEAWDNVGLLVGDPQQTVTRVLLCIDYTAAVAQEAAQLGCDGVIAYHPPIFSPLKRLTGGVVFDAVRRGVAIYSPHTALDVADGGTNDVLADVLGLTQRGPLKPSKPATSQFKLVTFAPATTIESLSQALFAAGAGNIGNYSSCSFLSVGKGTFFGEEGTEPAVGEAGQLEMADEIRLETLVPAGKVAAVVTALRTTHPYEEPAFDLVPLATPPTTQGIGRIGQLVPAVARTELFARIKRELAIDHLLIVGPTDGAVSKAAVCAGSCGDLLNNAIAAGVDLYLTGEMKHHDAMKAVAAGVTVVCTLHSHSERVTLKRLQSRLSTALPRIAFVLSTMDRDPFTIR
jgi:dinuclear metal center YbgI/SA1388 family protein